MLDHEPEGIIIKPGYRRTLARSKLNEAEGCEGSERLADNCSRYLEILRKDRLCRQPITGLEILIPDNTSYGCHSFANEVGAPRRCAFQAQHSHSLETCTTGFF
jgi:hypothetical protein